MINVNVYAGDNYLPAADAKYNNLIWEEISGGLKIRFTITKKIVSYYNNNFINFPNTGYSDPGIYFQCPSKDINTIGRVGAVTNEDVQSWEGCSQKCQEMKGCKYWTWHHGNTAQYLRYKCMTMTDAAGRGGDPNTVSGRRDCL